MLQLKPPAELAIDPCYDSIINNLMQLQRTDLSCQATATPWHADCFSYKRKEQGNENQDELKSRLPTEVREFFDRPARESRKQGRRANRRMEMKTKTNLKAGIKPRK